ncbi:hypothetical protein BK146_16930 [Paenibacillus sp. FSL R7-0333]|nr:hypothetical protein BK146_16930 [Paenibacillus sp. FSL R7-0333]
MGDCMYPRCKEAASQTWALVPLCEGHRQEISAETALYYSKGSMTYHERARYMRILHLIPWSRKE